MIPPEINAIIGSMNQIDKNKLIKSFIILLAVFLFVGTASCFHKKNSMTLDEYAKLQSDRNNLNGNIPDSSDTDLSGSGNLGKAPSVSADDLSAGDAISPGDLTEPDTPVTTLTGALLNGGADGQAMLAERVTYVPSSGTAEESFYYEPLSENLQRYITGVSFPATDAESGGDTAIGFADLRYVHIMHYNFDAEVTEGELICNAAIAPDLLDIFYELYRNEYRIEKVRLIDEYNGDDTASMEDNNTSCFNYREVEGTSNLSKHALGLALDINPFYNPYVTYENGSTRISPAASAEYADRDADFPYKIDENDLCYKLFIRHGFTWGGNWNSLKDYQHFQKAL